MNDADKMMYRKLAENLLIAINSYRLGVSMEHYKKAYFKKNEEIDDYWYKLAMDINMGTIINEN